MSKVILDCSDFALPSSVIGSENSRHPLDQSVTWAMAVSRAFSLRVLIGSQWFFPLRFCDIHAKRVSNGPLQLLWSKSTGRKPRGISEPTNTAGLVVLVSPVAIAGRYFGSTGE